MKFLWPALLLFSFIYSTKDINNINKIFINIPPTTIILEDAKDRTRELYRRLEQHKIKYTIISLVGIYSGIQLYLLHKAHFLHDEKAWHNWYNFKTLNELTKTAKNELYTELKNEIENRYETPNASIMMNLSQFLQDTSKEMQTLKSYLSMLSWLSLLKMNYIFLVSIDNIKLAKEKIRRLQYLRTVVATNLEPKNTDRSLKLINAYRKLQSWMPRVLNRHH